MSEKRSFLEKNRNNLHEMKNGSTSRVERIRLRLPASPVVPIKALPAAPLHLIKLSEQMKPARNRSSSFKDRTTQLN
jgi:hypothetical protein